MMTEEQSKQVQQVLEELKEDLANIDPEATEAMHAAYDYYLAMGPRISLDDNPVDTIADVVRKAPMFPESYDAAKNIAADLLDKGEVLGGELGSFIAKVLRGEIERPKPKNHQGKDARGDAYILNPMLIEAIYRLEKLGVSPTKNVNKGHRGGGDDGAPCGCDLVAAAANKVLRAKGRAVTATSLQAKWSGPEGKQERGWLDCLPD